MIDFWHKYAKVYMKLKTAVMKKIFKFFVSTYRFFFPLSYKEKRRRQSIAERWGEYEQPASGIRWYLGRRMYGWTEYWPDSKVELERLGFKILGIQDDMRYIVEPPVGFAMKIKDPERGLHREIRNADGAVVLTCFNEQELHDSRAYISDPKRRYEPNTIFP